eukprot:5100167-Pyramimonas_sp.AAC.1
MHLPPALGKGWHAVDSTVLQVLSQVHGFLPGKSRDAAEQLMREGLVSQDCQRFQEAVVGPPLPYPGGPAF